MRLRCRLRNYPVSQVSKPERGLMLVLNEAERNGSGPRSLPASETAASRHRLLNHLLFDLCEDCLSGHETMSCIPPSAFTSRHVRESQRQVVTGGGRPSFKRQFNDIVKELNPLQYNSKMMNSVWGLYNRYSSHNVKTNNDVCLPSSEEVQLSAASSKSDPIINLPDKMKWDHLWSSLNFSQSH